ncbi:DoxX family protein [Geomonas subterranea]|uniref:DoxX family protein n=1 Tax=Geomonas subterranea TaxID=2847989 RepID=A0ABX8LME4_9BACT|nr:MULTISPECIES: DoxX family protein [Geomonas]QXE91900.1 DoxX family protein [Geomonas subterranea]QXM10009.1 DoxX family protein [Geomonas subterranea]
MERILLTNDSWKGTVLRVGLGLVMFLHGAQNLLGWFGGLGFEHAMSVMTTQLMVPKMFAVLIIMTQFFGGIALLIGAYVRIAASAVIVVMLASLGVLDYGNGFLTTWSGKQLSPGVEFQLLAITVAINLIIWGAGRWSIDRALESPRSRISRERAAREAELTVQPPSNL